MSGKSNSFTSLLDKKLPNVRSYISGNILPKGGTLLFGGESKIGKSFLALNMAKSLSTGTELYNSKHIQCEECKVLLIEQEIGEEGLQLRGSKIFTDVSNRNKVTDNFAYETKLDGLTLNKLEGQKKLRDLVAINKPNVLILDPIGKMHTCDENSASEIGALFTYLDTLKKINPEQNMSIVFTHHFKKLDKNWVRSDEQKLDAHNFRGSNRWFSDPDTIVTAMIKRRYDNDNPRYKWWEIRTKFHLRQEEEPDDMLFSINEQNDGQVRYKYSINTDDIVIGAKKTTNCSSTNPIINQKPTQGMMFRP